MSAKLLSKIKEVAVNYQIVDDSQFEKECNAIYRNLMASIDEDIFTPVDELILSEVEIFYNN